MSARYLTDAERDARSGFPSRFHSYLTRLLAGSGLALLAAGCPVEEGVACLDNWPDSQGECTTDRFVPDETSFCRDDARWVVRAVNGEAERRSIGSAWGDDDDDSGGLELCCVDADVQRRPQGSECVPPVAPPGGTVVDGRPLVVDGHARTAPLRPATTSAWTVAPAADVRVPRDPAIAAALAAHWRRAAQFEHASVASFAAFTLDLVRFGAPPDLLVAAQKAAADEVRHARLCLGIAEALSGEAVEPGRLPLPADARVLHADLAAFAAATVREGCIGETLAAVRAAERLSRTSCPASAEVLRTLVEDEGAHARLAWRTVAWALRVGGPDVRSAVQAAFAAAPEPEPACDLDLRSWGVLDAAEAREADRRALDALIAPAARELLENRPLHVA